MNQKPEAKTEPAADVPVEAIVSQLVECITRLAVAVERLESPEMRAEREATEINQSWQDRAKRWADRRAWAMDRGLVDVRARKAWARSDLAVEDTTGEHLKGVRNCGEKTIAVIMEWVQTMSG